MKIAVIGLLILGFATDLPGQWRGMPLPDALDELRSQGLELVYSSERVHEGLVVTAEPPAGDALDQALAMLQPHGLTLSEVAGLWVVVPEPGALATGPSTGSLMLIISNSDDLAGAGFTQVASVPVLPTPEDMGGGIWSYTGVSPGEYDLELTADGFRPELHTVVVAAGGTAVVRTTMQRGPAELDTLIVSASRYVLFSNSQFFIDQRAIQALPDLGEDPVRAVHRLPGTAASGLSSRSHFRGGEHNETAIYLNGMKLMDPFHIRDYHSIFSSIDARAVSGVEAYTGGFPATYGNQMSGVLLLETQQADRRRRWEIGLSVYNTSLLASGFSDNGSVDWLVTARRSNLGLFLKDSLGKPDYADVFANVGFDLNDRTRLTVNALWADDQVTVTLESDPEELEQSVSDTGNQHFWLSLENQWTADLASTTVASWSRLENRRRAEVNDPEKVVSFARDIREAEVFGFKQDWRYDGLADHTLDFGFELRRENAHYDYTGVARHIGFWAGFPGLENPDRRRVLAAPEGSSYSIYLSDRWYLSDRTTAEAGLRWDRQTYTDPAFDGQLSPRLSLLHMLGDQTDLRLTWGRYYQPQGIHELQVEDGLDQFFQPQRSDHWIAGLRHRFSGGYRLRAEVFWKDYSRLKPRFENLYDPLALIPELHPDRVRLDPESAESRGVELTLEYPGGEEWTWWVSYTWSKVTDRINGRDQRRSWDQRHAVQAGLSWRRGPWEIGLAASVHSGWPTTGMTLGMVSGDDENEEDEGDEIGDEFDEDDDESEYFPIPGPRNAEQLGHFASIDFRISREFDVPRGRLSAFLEVTNATNRKNPCCIDYDIDEDDDGNVFLDKTVDYWLPIIPAIGILWEF